MEILILEFSCHAGGFRLGDLGRGDRTGHESAWGERGFGAEDGLGA